mmetsp:Transcript_21444/g.24294  ORF Transcript_21444/g.24294 Transcript_21444/m.24294 type:complete len:88 (-) Transcript_21444:273-536(-)
MSSEGLLLLLLDFFFSLGSGEGDNRFCLLLGLDAEDLEGDLPPPPSEIFSCVGESPLREIATFVSEFELLVGCEDFEEDPLLECWSR